MADTPEEVARELLDSGLCAHGERNEFLHAYECEVCLPKALREAEARGFAKGLEAAEATVMVPWDSLGDRPPSPPAALYNACARIRALAPKAPPAVAAAEPKP